MSDALVAELEIRNLIAQLAHASDVAALDDLDARYLDLFTEDATWETRIRPAADGTFAPARRGRADIREGVLERRSRGLQGPGTHSLHVVTTTALQVDRLVARAQSCFLFLTGLDSQPRTRFAGHYFDEFRHEQGRWRLAHRVIVAP